MSELIALLGICCMCNGQVSDEFYVCSMETHGNSFRRVVCYECMEQSRYKWVKNDWDIFLINE